MSAAPQFRLKRPTGWFAAGDEVGDALNLLSDAAFRLYMWLCLHADRSSGSVLAGKSALVRTMGRSQEQIVSALDELVRKRICILYIDEVIEITDRFWPYRRAAVATKVTGRAGYVGRIRRIFLERRCVQSTFTHADEQFAAELHQMAVPVIDVERAILLGSLRKYAAIVNNGNGTPITSLHYFRGLLNEAGRNISPDYWTYLAQK
ncbi:MAG: helix-turn-helix domain-containing protein, partial [Acidobacteriota bacterium]